MCGVIRCWSGRRGCSVTAHDSQLTLNGNCYGTGVVMPWHSAGAQRFRKPVLYPLSHEGRELNHRGWDDQGQQVSPCRIAQRLLRAELAPHIHAEGCVTNNYWLPA